MSELQRSPRTRPGSDTARVTAIVTTFNEEKNVAACLDTLAWCDEILVVDSFSTDRTPEIVQEFARTARVDRVGPEDGASEGGEPVQAKRPTLRFLQHEYFGGAAQKNWAIVQAAHEWVLIFDADERCTPELRAEIGRLLEASPDADAYVIRRRVHFLDKVIKHSGWRNDRVVRMFRRDKGRYQNRRVHSRVVIEGDHPAMHEAPVLENPMEHLMVDSIAEYIDRTRRYSWWGAAQMWRDGKRTTGWLIFQRTVWRFLRTYIVQRGFLDGVHGLVFCLLQSVGTYMKLATLWGWEVNESNGIEPDLPTFDDDEDLWKTPTGADGAAPDAEDPGAGGSIEPDAGSGREERSERGVAAESAG